MREHTFAHAVIQILVLFILPLSAASQSTGGYIDPAAIPGLRPHYLKGNNFITLFSRLTLKSYHDAFQKTD